MCVRHTSPAVACVPLVCPFPLMSAGGACSPCMNVGVSAPTRMKVGFRTSFDGYDHSTPWEAAQVSYFSSYAMWTYLTSPFLFTYPGVEAHEIEPWQEDGQTWRRLKVTFPDTIVTHSQEQTFYYDADGMQRRMDYIVDINGSVEIAHLIGDLPTFW